MGKLYNTFFFGIFGIITLSIVMLGYHVLNGNTDIWQWFVMIPLALYLGHTWVIMILLCVNDFRKKKFGVYYGEKISVLMPIYNERPDLLTKAVESVVKAWGNKEILLINDGSTNGIMRTMIDLARKYPEVRLMGYLENRGKRAALHFGAKSLHEKTRYVVCLDSDTLINKFALVKIVMPLRDPKMGATTGNILVLNEKKNWITRINAAYYWTGLNIYKQAQSVMGSVACCSGCLSAYRREIIDKVIDKFIEERFFGQLCTHSEDRHLTNLTLELGYNVLYVPDAISYTETPDTVGGFIRQQKRWKGGFLRESVYALTFTWRTHPALFLWILLWDIGLPFLIVGMKVILLAMMIFEPMTFLTTVVPAWIVWTAVRYMILVFRAPSKLPGTFLFAFFSELVLYWVTLYALVTVQNRKWVTR